ncbi:MAG: hypothetical protein MZV70_40025 [Desulfobacterales bacterium]|nr:hypothetical protein [Desulfobacterales bacterium]
MVAVCLHAWRFIGSSSHVMFVSELAEFMSERSELEDDLKPRNVALQPVRQASTSCSHFSSAIVVVARPPGRRTD